MFGNILSGVVKIALSPVKAIAEVIDDVSGRNGDDSQGASIFSLGTTSLVKGLAKGIKEGADEIFED